MFRGCRVQHHQCHLDRGNGYNNIKDIHLEDRGVGARILSFQAWCDGLGAFMNGCMVVEITVSLTSSLTMVAWIMVFSMDGRDMS